MLIICALRDNHWLLAYCFPLCPQLGAVVIDLTKLLAWYVQKSAITIVFGMVSLANGCPPIDHIEPKCCVVSRPLQTIAPAIVICKFRSYFGLSWLCGRSAFCCREGYVFADLLQGNNLHVKFLDVKLMKELLSELLVNKWKGTSYILTSWKTIKILDFK